ncbi:hypothetical protein FRB95_012975 [Tulasnella sp. JGI-2019a]|nr:hypothetical protein FRB95_012975 [Tulasnella sp. JGI-2019a]
MEHDFAKHIIIDSENQELRQELYGNIKWKDDKLDCILLYPLLSSFLCQDLPLDHPFGCSCAIASSEVRTHAPVLRYFKAVVKEVSNARKAAEKAAAKEAWEQEKAVAKVLSDAAKEVERVAAKVARVAQCAAAKVAADALKEVQMAMKVAAKELKDQEKAVIKAQRVKKAADCRALNDKENGDLVAKEPELRTASKRTTALADLDDPLLML